jgi:hypothetical protein
MAHFSTLVMRQEAFVRAATTTNSPIVTQRTTTGVLRIAKVGEVGLITQPQACIRRNGTSWYQGGSEKVSAGLEYLLAKHPDFVSSLPGHARLPRRIPFARSSLGQQGLALRLTRRSLPRWPARPTHASRWCTS